MTAGSDSSSMRRWLLLAVLGVFAAGLVVVFVVSRETTDSAVTQEVAGDQSTMRIWFDGEEVPQEEIRWRLDAPGAAHTSDTFGLYVDDVLGEDGAKLLALHVVTDMAAAADAREAGVEPSDEELVEFLTDNPWIFGMAIDPAGAGSSAGTPSREDAVAFLDDHVHRQIVETQFHAERMTKAIWVEAGGDPHAPVQEWDQDAWNAAFDAWLRDRAERYEVRIEVLVEGRYEDLGIDRLVELRGEIQERLHAGASSPDTLPAAGG